MKVCPWAVCETRRNRCHTETLAASAARAGVWVALCMRDEGVVTPTAMIVPRTGSVGLATASSALVGPGAGVCSAEELPCCGVGVAAFAAGVVEFR